MIRTWPGQTDEEWMKELHRHIRLTPEEQKKEYEDVYGTFEEREAKREQERLQRIKEREERQRKYEESIAYMDHPNTMDDGTATFFYIAIMLIAIIFKERWFIWIAATIRYVFHMTRHERAAEMRKNKKMEEQR